MKWLNVLYSLDGPWMSTSLISFRSSIMCQATINLFLIAQVPPENLGVALIRHQTLYEATTCVDKFGFLSCDLLFSVLDALKSSIYS